jgi:phenylacetate-coenzyme A ligase PaaK-like adenylate-forming protein
MNHGTTSIGSAARLGRAGWLLLVALSATALGQEAPRTEPRELIYGAELMTPQEREQYRKDVAGAKAEQARAGVRAQHRTRLRERARERGVELREPDGVVRAGPK